MPVADSDMVVDASSQAASGQDENILPVSLSSPAADILKNFYHTKRVGNYLIGRKLGEGSFAKVREGLHAMTGEKVRTVRCKKGAGFGGGDAGRRGACHVVVFFHVQCSV